MDKEYIIKHGLMEAHKEFMRLSEGYLATNLSEEGENDENKENMSPEGMNNPQGDEQSPMDNPMQGQEQGMQQQGQPMPPADAPMPDEAGMPSPEESMEGMDIPPMKGPMPKEEENDVLDVEDLTQAQEKLNKKQNSLGHDLGDVNDKISSLLAAIEKIQGSIDKNNNDIIDLKSEIEKRVPTDKEKLQMQSLNMYPYNVSPNDYWKDKEKEGKYQVNDDKEKEYKLTNKDIDDYSEKEIENSFDDELHQTMKDIFKGF